MSQNIVPMIENQTITPTEDRNIVHDRTKWDGLIKWLIVGSSFVFILVLALSAVFEASIRVPHTFQALIYVAVIILAVKRSPLGIWRRLFHGRFLEVGAVPDP